jgi:predicted DNA-binding antitoxin AbrB/MazE fold protein
MISGGAIMPLTFEATYENGVLKPHRPLPLKEQEKVLVTVDTPEDVHKALDAVERSYGVLRWTGDVQTLRRVAEDDEFGILESP